MQAFVAKIRTVKISFGASGGIFAKFAPAEVSRYTVVDCHQIAILQERVQQSLLFDQAEHWRHQRTLAVASSSI